MLPSHRMSTNHVNGELTISYLSRRIKAWGKVIGSLTFGIMTLAAQQSYGVGVWAQEQTTSSKAQECDGIKTSHKVGNAPSDGKQSQTSIKESTASGDQRTSNSGKDSLRLSTKPDEEQAADPQGQFCKRENGEQHNAWRPSNESVQSDQTSPQRQSTKTEPIAQYSGGKLTIHAHGEDFTTVLNAVKSVTGVSVEMPPEGQSERIFTSVGPVSMRDALIALLDGSKYNYMIVESPGDPQVAKRLILSTRRDPGPSSMIASARDNSGSETQDTSVYGSQGFQDDSQAQAVEPQQQSPPPIQPVSVPSSVPTGVNVQQIAADSHKTPGQVLDELQKHQMEMLDNQAAQTQQQQPQ